MKKLLLLPIIALAAAMIASAAPTVSNGTITYDFEDCSDLNDCGLNETGYNAGLNQSNIQIFGGSNVLYYNGQRKSSPLYDYYKLSFLETPTNATTLEFDIYPIDASYAEVGIYFRLNTSDIQFSPKTGLTTSNTDYSNYVNFVYDFNGAGQNLSCSNFPAGQWNRVKVELDFEQKTYNYYLNNMTSPDCYLNWSSHEEDVGNLGELAMIATNTGDTPNVYFDNITFTGAVSEVPGTPVSIVSRTPTTNPNITQGDVQNFTVNAYDADNDTLSYTWTVNGTDQLNNASYFEFDTTGITGTATVAVNVSDLDGSDSTSWTATINIPPLVITGYVATYSAADTDDIVIDGLGTAGVTFNAFIPILVIVALLGAGAVYLGVRGYRRK